MKYSSPLTYILSLMALSMPVVAEAHPFHWATQSIGFTSGFFHQLNDIDHILLLLAIGFGFSKPGIKAQVGLPSVFAMLMVTGAALPIILFDINGIQNIEGFVALTSLLLLALGCKVLRLPKRMVMVGILALYHGYTHTYDMLLDTDATSFTIGYITLTVVLILFGIALNMLIKRTLSATQFFEQYG